MTRRPFALSQVLSFLFLFLSVPSALMPTPMLIPMLTSQGAAQVEAEDLVQEVIAFFAGVCEVSLLLFLFLIIKETEKEIFVHVSGLVDEVKENDEVTFDVAEGRKGPNAVDVRLA